MAKSSNANDGVVSALLAERNQVQTWITRLESAKDTTPEAVRTKVMSDYQTRLDQVVAKLQEHGDAVREQLEQRKGRRDELTAEETKAKETLAEAELRHTVGEYDEADWTKFRAESNKTLVGVREELGKVSEDIERLAEVAKLIAAPVAPPPAPPKPAPAPTPPPAAAKPAPAPEPEPAPTEAKKRESGRAEFVPSAPKAKPPADELEFLRSTVGEGDDAPAKPAPKAEKEKEKKPKGEAAAAPAAIATPVPEPDLPKPRGSTESNRTLKCPECGTMNRPTEWYCERCGSELAGV
jgi:hypothetical protein